MVRPVIGIMHIHTRYSYDGSVSLKEVVTVAQEKGHSFVLLTEHSDDFDAEKMKRFVAECERLSSPDMAVIAGLEVNCDFGRHLLGIGVKQNIGMAAPDRVIDSIKEQGGLAILPHPHLYQFRSFVSATDKLNGIEVWNRRYDGKYAPNPKALALLEGLRRENPNIFAYGGLDLHAIKEFVGLCLEVDVIRISEDEILSKLEEGTFKVVKKKAEISAAGEISRVQKVFFDLAACAHLLGETFFSRAR